MSSVGNTSATSTLLVDPVIVRAAGAAAARANQGIAERCGLADAPTPMTEAAEDMLRRAP